MTSRQEEVSASPKDSERSHTRGRAADGVEANARLTGSTAAVLFVLLAAEGVTILRVRPLLSWHVFIGMLLVPPVALKIGTTSYRFVRYYRGSPAYRRKGPPPQLLRLLGPFVVVLTFVVLASGIALLLVPPSQRRSLLFLHKASFVLWFGAMAIHVVGHFVDTAKLAPRLVPALPSRRGRSGHSPMGSCLEPRGRGSSRAPSPRTGVTLADVLWEVRGACCPLPSPTATSSSGQDTSHRWQ